MAKAFMNHEVSADKRRITLWEIVRKAFHVICLRRELPITIAPFQLDKYTAYTRIYDRARTKQIVIGNTNCFHEYIYLE